MKLKKCKKCGKEKPTVEFQLNITMLDNRESNCKECKNLLAREARRIKREERFDPFF